jgi:RNA polymerase sigma-70 factor (ECF subfamily)
VPVSNELQGVWIIATVTIEVEYPGAAVTGSFLGFNLQRPLAQWPAAAEQCEVEGQEQQLVEGLQQAAEEAYETLIAHYQEPVYNLIFRLLKDQSDACDVVQEVFLKIFRNIGSFRGESSLRTWIYRIAVNEAFNHRRWFGRHAKREVGLDAGETGDRTYNDTLADRGPSPFDCAAGAETSAFIEEALARLNPAFRTAVVLRDIEEMSYEEIADVLQVSLGTVKSRILRGRDALRRELSARLRPEPVLDMTPQPAK